MIYGLPFAIPRTAEWLREKLDLRGQHQIRAVLRGLERSCDARLVVLWASEGYTSKHVVDFYGDDAVLPPELPDLASSVPSREVVQDKHGEEHDAVVFKIRVGKEVPTLGLAIVVPGVEEAAPLFDAVEAAGEQVESIIVDAVDRTRPVGAQRRARRVRAED